MPAEVVRFILEAYRSQEPVLLLVAGRVWEGHVQSCLEGTLVAIARPVGQSRPYSEQQWRLDEIASVGRREPTSDDEDEDELLVNARLMVQQARDYSDMSLAERLLDKRNRTTGEEHHGRS